MDETLHNLMYNLIKDPETTNEQLMFFEERLWKNQTLSESKLMSSLFFSVIALTIWFIIKSANIEKLSFLGMEFTELSIPLLALPPIAAFFYYRFHCETALNSFIKEILKEYYSQKLQPFEKRHLTKLLVPPTFYNLEQILINIAEDRNSLLYKTTNVWGIIMDLAIVFVPILLMLWILYSMLTSPILGVFWSIVSSALVLVLIARSLMVLIYSSMRLTSAP